VIRVSTKEIIDILPYGDGKAILVEKVPLANLSKFKASYSVIDFENSTKNVLTKNAYLLKKFGASFKTISETIPNFVQCDAALLYDRRVLVIYPNGEAGIFDREGELSWSGYFKYHDEIVYGPMQVDLRIGGKDAATFVNPTHISFDDGDIYVCSGGNKVRRIDGSNLTVSDHLTFDESVKQYHRFGKNSIAVLTSGTYLIEEK